MGLKALAGCGEQGRHDRADPGVAIAQRRNGSRCAEPGRRGDLGRTLHQISKVLRPTMRATGGNAINASARESVHDTAVIAKPQGR